jgi:hypothetical protein
MKDWKEHQSEEVDKSSGQLDKLVWTDDGHLVSVRYPYNCYLVHALVVDEIYCWI